MFIPTSREVKSAAQASLKHPSYDPKKLALIYAAIATGVSLFFTIMNYILAAQIDSFDGLAGLGVKSILSTVQTILPILSMLFVPFWEIGMLRAGMGFMRDEQVSPNTLTAGFRRFGPVLRLLLLRTVLLFAIVLISINVSSVIFSVTPWSAPIENFLQTVTETGTLTEEMISQMMPSMVPLYIIFFVVCCLLAIPFFYRLRMADFIVMDKPAGALAALLFSHRLMRGNRFRLFKLDLSFWWYYVIGFFSIAICYLDTIFQMLGIPFPTSPDVAFFLCYGLYALIHFFLCWQAESYINTAYAIAFDSIAPKAPETPTAEQAQ